MGQFKSREMAKREISDECGISIPLLLLEGALVPGWLRTRLQFNASVGKLGMYPQRAQAGLTVGGNEAVCEGRGSDLVVVKVFKLICYAPLEFTGW